MATAGEEEEGDGGVGEPLAAGQGDAATRGVGMGSRDVRPGCTSPWCQAWSRGLHVPGMVTRCPVVPQGQGSHRAGKQLLGPARAFGMRRRRRMIRRRARMKRTKMRRTRMRRTRMKRTKRKRRRKRSVMRILGGGRGGRRCPRGIEERRQLLLASAVAQAAPCQHRPPQGHHRLGTVVALLGPSPQSQRVLLRPRCHRSHVSSAPEQHPAPSPPQRGFWGCLGAWGTHQPTRATPSLCHLPPAPRINPKPHPPTRPLPAPLLPQRCPGSPGWVPGAGEVRGGHPKTACPGAGEAPGPSRGGVRARGQLWDAAYLPARPGAARGAACPGAGERCRRARERLPYWSARGKLAF